MAKLDGLDRLKRRLAGLPGNLTEPVRVTIQSGAHAVRNEAVRSLQEHRSQGPTEIRYSPRREVQPSLPGNPPNTDRGELASSVHIRIDEDGMGANVDARAKHAIPLEFGTTKMAARPFLFPAFEMNRQRIQKAVKDAIMNALKRRRA